MEGFNARALVSGMGRHLYDLRFTAAKGPSAPAVIPTPTVEATPWITVAQPSGLMLIQRRASDRKSCLRFATWDDVEEGLVSDYCMPMGGPDPVHGAIDPYSGHCFVAAHGDCLKAMIVSAFPDGVRCMTAAVTIPVGSKCSQAYWHPSLPGVLYATNLGRDRILRYSVSHIDEPASFSAASVVLQQELVLPAGSGPRRMVIDGASGLGWIINELGASISCISVDAESGELMLESTISSLPPDASSKEGITSAQIVLSSDRSLLFASNRSDRGEDSIAVFRTGIDEESTALTPLGWVTAASAAAELDAAAADTELSSVILKAPRDMAILSVPQASQGDGSEGNKRDYLLVANQAGETLTVFAVAEPSSSSSSSSSALPLRALACVRLPQGAQPTCVLPLTSHAS